MSQPQFTPVSFDRHANKLWRRFTSYHFAQSSAVLPLVAAELAKSVMAFPIAFIQDEAGAYTPVAVLGFNAGQNLFIAPDGRWLGRYIPAVLRGHPFRLASLGNDKLALCVDDNSELVQEVDGEPFFTADGQIAPSVAQLMEFLRQLEHNRQLTITAMATLANHQLLQPWPIKIDQGAAGERQLTGLYRVDEAAFNNAPLEVLTAVRAAGGLPIVYCQLLSMQHLSMLGEMAAAQARAQAQLLQKSKELFTFPDDGLLHFD
ncbi:SapC family protein [Rhodoferax sp. 4810]|uniref:SapC family protein n=1 Tax=Thiospirillum jenense TaxID=1653858 RepID=A0A839HCH7_9GAMM|nr:SapC family protein [Thiospirillum jenense]MBB1074805.1 SapC family protein [Rhodoferax jenense]MBB1126643.1 SapC family protein [Thiospirillum jenense]